MVHTSLLCEQTAFIGAGSSNAASSGLEMDELFSFGTLSWDSPPPSPEYIPGDAATAFLDAPPAAACAQRKFWAHSDTLAGMDGLNLWTPPASPPHARGHGLLGDNDSDDSTTASPDYPLLDDLLVDSDYSLSPSLAECELMSAEHGSRKRKALDMLADADHDEHSIAGVTDVTDVASHDDMVVAMAHAHAVSAYNSSDEEEEQDEATTLFDDISESTPSPRTVRGSMAPTGKRSRLSRSGPSASFSSTAAATRAALSGKSVEALGELPLPDALQALSVIRGKADGTEVKRISHNILERKRRNDLKTCYNALRSEIPTLVGNDRAPTSHILQYAHEYVRTLQKQDKKLEQQLAAARAEQRRLRARIAAASGSR
jgi:hypothetical protein